jgi:hypothetical protein
VTLRANRIQAASIRQFYRQTAVVTRGWPEPHPKPEKQETSWRPKPFVQCQDIPTNTTIS